MDILVVDDEATLRRTIRTALESGGHRVSEAASQAQAVQQFAAAKPDLVLLDLRLGRESGLDVPAALHRAAPGLGVVVITAHASIDTAVEAMRQGALDYLPKPFTPKQLADQIARWGRRSAECRVQNPTEWNSAPKSRSCGRRWTRRSPSPPATPPSSFAGRTGPARGCWPGPSTPAAGGRPGRS